MSFGPKAGAMPLPETAPPPPNPPMFGSNAAPGQRQRKSAQQNTGFSTTMLGEGGAANTSNKTLLGQ